MGQLLGGSLSQSVSRSLNHIISGKLCQLNSLSVGHRVSQVVIHWVIESVRYCKSVSQSIESVNHLVSGSLSLTTVYMSYKVNSRYKCYRLNNINFLKD